jgi:hypothetical protein
VSAVIAFAFIIAGIHVQALRVPSMRGVSVRGWLCLPQYFAGKTADMKLS